MSVLTPIPNCPGYEITIDGRVWSRKRNRWLKTYIDSGTGYRVVTLTLNGRWRPMKLSRLLLETFVSPCPPGRQCHHKNGNKVNDDLGNLVWVTPFENTAARGSTRKKKLNRLQVHIIKHLIHSGELTQCEIASYFDVGKTIISAIKIGKYWPGV